MSLHHRALEDDPHRPLSAMGFGYRDNDSATGGSSRASLSQDVDMDDAGASSNVVPDAGAPTQSSTNC